MAQKSGDGVSTVPAVILEFYGLSPHAGSAKKDWGF
jgi:hypothetical protein